MPLDYSKWNHIEVSDDEDDTHPNIDTASLFRWRHQARMERMAQSNQAKEEVEQGKKRLESLTKEIDEELKVESLTEEKRAELKARRDELKRQEEEFAEKERQLAEEEKKQPWNVDTIGREGWSKSYINKPAKEVVNEPAEEDDTDDKKDDDEMP